MIIYSVTLEDYDFEEKTLVHMTSCKNKHEEALVELKGALISIDIDDYETCPVCHYALSDHGKLDECDTLESCIEVDEIYEGLCNI